MSELIAAHPFARGMNPAAIGKLADFAMETTFETDEMVFREGDPANRFYLILDGRIALEAFVEGQGQVAVQTIGAGDVLGWSWMFPPFFWHFDARALEPTRAIFLYGTPLLERCEEDHDLGFELYKRMSAIVVSRLQAARRKLLECQCATGGQPAPT